MFVGRDEPGKGLDVLLDAWSRVRLAPPSAALALVGVDGMPGGVGPQPPASVRNFLSTADVVVVPSRRTSTFREPWGLVVNEAMHAGTPVIATDQVGAAAGGLVRNGRNGLVVPSEDPGALAAALRLLRDDPDLRARLAAAARRGRRPVHLQGLGGGIRRGAAASVTPMRLRLSLALLVILLVPAASAWASGRDVLRDCADDEVLSKAYTQKEYRDALSELATDSSEYSDCESVIRRAQLEQAAGRDKKQSGGGGTTTTPGGGSSAGGGGSTGSSGATPAPTDSTPTPAPAARGTDPLAALNPEERLALDEARTGGGEGIQGSGPAVVPPGSSRAPNLTGSSSLPGPITGLLILLAGALIIVTGARVRTRVLGRRTA